MNIIFLSRLFYPHIGGVEKHVYEVGKRLVKHGHTVTIITEQLDDSILNKKIPSTEIIEGILVHRIDVGENNWLKKFRVWKQMLTYKQLIKKATIVHCHDVFFWYVPYLFIFPSKKVFTTFHGYEDYPVPKKAIIVRKFSEALSRGSVCIGDFMTVWYRSNPTAISYGGVELHTLPKDEYKKGSALFIGRLDEQTSISTYLFAVNIIKKTFPKFHFAIIGDGKIRRDIDKEVKVHGFLPDPQKYFAHFQFAFVSRYLTILEAIAAKRLVFAVSDNPLKDDYLRLAPFAEYIVICESGLQLAKEVLFYMKHPQQEEKKIKEGYAWVKKQTWENVISMYLSLWKK